MTSTVDPKTFREDLPVTDEEAAAYIVWAEAKIVQYRRRIEEAKGQLMRALDAQEAKEMVVGDYTIVRTEDWGSYEWQKGLLEELAKPLLNPEQWQKAVHYVQVPEHEEMHVNTARMKAALSAKGLPGKRVLEQTMTRKLRNVGVKVERNG